MKPFNRSAELDNILDEKIEYRTIRRIDYDELGSALKSFLHDKFWDEGNNITAILFDEECEDRLRKEIKELNEAD